VIRKVKFLTFHGDAMVGKPSPSVGHDNIRTLGSMGMRVRITLTLDVDPQKWADVRGGSERFRTSLDARHDLRAELCEYLDAYLREHDLGEVIKLQA
jgi:hypothetical protein